MKRLCAPSGCFVLFAAINFILYGLISMLSACGGPVHVAPSQADPAGPSLPSAPHLVSIKISPDGSALTPGQTLQLAVARTYSNGTDAAQTASVQWSTSNPAVAAVSDTGLVSAKGIGTSAIGASVGGLTTSAKISVNSATPQSIAIAPIPTSIALGATTQLTVTATLTDGTTQDVTNMVVWKVTDSTVISIDSTGLLSGLKAGTSNFGASLGTAASAITANSSATVAPAYLKALQVSAYNLAMPLGTSQQLTVTGVYSDGTSDDLTATAAWSSSAASVASVTTTGNITALGLGSASISVAAGEMNTSISLNVGPPILSSITISPADPQILVGQTLQLTATGTYSDNSTSDLTSTVLWSVANPAILQLQNSNASALSAGSSAVTATLNGSDATSTVVVQPVALLSYFSIAPGQPDTSVRMIGSAGADSEICTMVYVFSQDQQMAECCGCQISREGLRNLSLQKDLLSNPLTATAPASGTTVLVNGSFNANTPCDPTNVIPAGSGNAWATHIQVEGKSISGLESPFSQTALGPDLLANLQAQCTYIQILGSGRGVCSCGTGN